MQSEHSSRQNGFLNAARKQQRRVQIFLVNGVRMAGRQEVVVTLTYPIRSAARLASSVAGVLAISIACLLGLPMPSAGQPSAVVPNSPASRPPDSALSTDDLRFIDEVALTEAMEIQAAEMALELSGDPTILAYARLMLKDHRALAADLDRVARAEGITPDTRLPEAPEIARLRHLQGAEFDRVYVQVVAVDAHREAVTLFQRQAGQGKSPKLRAFVLRNMPILKQHLEQATNLAARMTVTS